MMRHPTLVIGLGKTGGELLRALERRLDATPALRHVGFLQIGAPPAEEGDLEAPRLDGSSKIDAVPLPMDLLRETMSGLGAWTQELPWLARFDESSFLDEIRPLGAAGFRGFARLAAVRADGLIDRALRRSLARVCQGSTAEHVDVLLLAGAGGGLGSALLPDVTFLLERHAPRSTRTACLVLPPPGESTRGRFDANAFATLCEVACLKAMKFPYVIRFETLPPIDVRTQRDEPWQRVYLFEAEDGETMPYPAAASRAAEVLALQLAPRLASRRRILSQDFTSVRVTPSAPPLRLEKAFSLCGGTTISFPPEVPGVYSQDPITPRALRAAWEAFAAAFDRLLLTQREELSGTRKRDLRGYHVTVGTIESQLDRAIRSPLEPAEKALAEIESGVNPALRKAGVQDPEVNSIHVTVTHKGDSLLPLEMDAQGLRALPGLDAALLVIHRFLHDPPPELPLAPDASPAPPSTPSALTQLEDLAALRLKAEAIWPGAVPPPVRAPRDRKLARPGLPFLRSLRRSMMWNLSERIATLQALLRATDFRDAFERALREVAHEWIGYRPEAVAENPSFEGWMAEAERRILDLEPRLFHAAARQIERRTFALLSLPRETPPGFDRDALRERLERSIEIALGCPAQVMEDDGESIRVYFEDLFHAASDLRWLPLYRASYVKEPIKELYHTDYRFLSGKHCEGMCEEDDRGTTVCGNPGCTHDIRRLSATVHTCPGCGKPIRSRCGNPGCKVRDLHLRPEANARTCPGCGGVNHAAWWLCCEHGKVEVFVPIDKEFCPECVRQHHEDPILWPRERISVRPDIRDRRTCWHCVEVQKANPDHEIFTIPPDLVEFVENGVNGHDRPKFFEMTKRCKLPEDHKCPSCGTLLVPVDHRG